MNPFFKMLDRKIQFYGGTDKSKEIPYEFYYLDEKIIKMAWIENDYSKSDEKFSRNSTGIC